MALRIPVHARSWLDRWLRQKHFHMLMWMSLGVRHGFQAKSIFVASLDGVSKVDDAESVDDVDDVDDLCG